MRRLLATFVILDLIATVIALVVPLSKPKASLTKQISPLDINEYFAQRNIPSYTQVEKAFASLLTTNTDVLAASTSADLTRPEPTEASTLTAKLKSNYKIAILGDSMVDTLGTKLLDLHKFLNNHFPQTKFELLNYGVGATDMEYGFSRLTNGYSYLGQSMPALLSTNPDIVVIESFAYNHWNNTQSDLDRHWLLIDKIIKTILNHNSDTKIVLAATIAPHCPTYTDGSANLPPERKYAECATVKAYLENLVNFATSQKYPLADAYHPSLISGDGNPKYINQGDHIHPSETGRSLIGEKIGQILSKLL